MLLHHPLGLGTTGCACLIHFAGMDVDTAIRTAKRCRPIIDPIGQVGFPPSQIPSLIPSQIPSQIIDDVDPSSTP